MNTVRDIKLVVYDRAERALPLVRSFLALEGPRAASYANEAELGAMLARARDEGLTSKQVLVLKRFLGRFFQVCPGSANVTCCRYRLINTGFNCLFNCTYCYLSSYLNSFGIVQFTNLDAALDELASFQRSADTSMVYRVGTGEFTDSLMMDEVTGFGRAIVSRAATMRNVMIELKTKSSRIDHLLDIREKGNAVLAWSLNTPRAIARYEEGAAGLDERLDAAARAVRAGYFVAFHFDPMILYPGCEEEYERVADSLFRAVDGQRVVWISLGCFRHSAGFRESLREAFPDEDLTLAEMFPGPDGKLRYLAPRRKALFRRMLARIRAHSSAPYVYLCMEPRHVWEDVFGRSFESNEELEADMSGHLIRTFGVSVR
ncbi:MAG: DNA photolyase [Spirochaetes bacterium]|nr:MAG: DNA photolyase [Spirochaetota bacterium]